MIVPYPYSSLTPVREDERHWWFHCCFHRGDGEASMVVNKTEPYRLFYRCWACNENGSAKTFAVKYLGHDPKLIDSYIECKVEWSEPMKEIIRPKINWDSLRGTPLEHLPAEEQRLAAAVGVSVETIRKFGIGWRDYKFLIPMYDEQGICGIAVRWYEEEDIGYEVPVTVCKKHCIKGSRHGWFSTIRGCPTLDPIFITEGWSDTATLVELGFQTVGRFNAASMGVPNYVVMNRPYIITDNDEAGITGSQKLQKLIGGTIISPPEKDTIYGNPRTKIWFKDIREFYLAVGKERCKQWLEEQL